MDAKAAPKVVSFHYTLKDETGAVLESSSGDEPLSYLEGAAQIIPGLETSIHGLKKGEKKAIHVKAVDAYGERELEMIVQVPRDQIPKKDVQVGDRFQAESGEGQNQVVVVTAVNDANITVDGNHPLAGKDLDFEVEVTDVRDATSEELQHGHAHGPHGHHDHDSP